MLKETVEELVGSDAKGIAIMTERISKGLLASVVIALFFGISGCINISTRTQPEDTSVRALLRGDDCVPIMLSFAYGKATIEEAKQNTRVLKDDGSLYMENAGINKVPASVKGSPITKVRRVEINEFMVLFFGNRCVVVTGE